MYYLIYYYVLWLHLAFGFRIYNTLIYGVRIPSFASTDTSFVKSLHGVTSVCSLNTVISSKRVGVKSKSHWKSYVLIARKEILWQTKEEEERNFKVNSQLVTAMRIPTVD